MDFIVSFDNSKSKPQPYIPPSTPRGVAIILSIIGCIIGMIMIVAGSMFVRRSLRYKQTVMSKVSNPQCTFTTVNSRAKTTCKVTLNYKVDGKDYSSSGVLLNNVVDGQLVPIHYNPSNPSDISYSSGSPRHYKIYGITLTTVGSIIVFWIAFLFINKYRQNID